MNKIITAIITIATVAAASHKLVIGARESYFVEAALKYDTTAAVNTKRFNALSDSQKKAVTRGLAIDEYNEDEYKLILARMNELS